jgi:hypothetical protein
MGERFPSAPVIEFRGLVARCPHRASAAWTAEAWAARVGPSPGTPPLPRITRGARSGSARLGLCKGDRIDQADRVPDQG